MKVVGSTPGVAHYAALSGLNVVTNASNSNNGTIYCQLAPWANSVESEMSKCRALLGNAAKANKTGRDQRCHVDRLYSLRHYRV